MRLQAYAQEAASMRSLWLVAVVAAVAGGAAGGALGWWLRAHEEREAAAPSTPDEYTLAQIARRLDRLEESLARAVPPAATLHGAPAATGEPRGAAQAPGETRLADIAAELEALRARVAELAATQEVLARKAGLPAPWPSEPQEVERIRVRWQSRLEEVETALGAEYPRGRDPTGDAVGWSRWDDHLRAKAAFEAATDSASLRALSEGEFRNFFTVAR